MDNKNLKNLLAGLSLAALVGGAGLASTGCATTGNQPTTVGHQTETVFDPTEVDNTDGNLSA